MSKPIDRNKLEDAITSAISYYQDEVTVNKKHKQTINQGKYENSVVTLEALRDALYDGKFDKEES